MAKAEYRSAIRSRKLINEAFTQLLLEKPLDKITVTDIVRRADINRGTFYAHYSDIPDLMQHLMDESFFRLRGALNEKENQISELPSIILHQIQWMLEENLVLIQKISNSGTDLVLQERLCNIVLDYFLAGEPLFSTISHEEYVFKLRFCAGGLSNLYRDWLAGRLPITLEELSQHAEKLLLHIITTI